MSVIPSGGGVVVTRKPIPPGNRRYFGEPTADGDRTGYEVVGYDYNVTFVENNGDLHDLVCELSSSAFTGGQHSYDATNPAEDALGAPLGKQCSVGEWTGRSKVDGVFLDGTWAVSLSHPHWQQAYDRSNPGKVLTNFTTAPLRFDASAAQVKAAIEAVYDDRSGSRVFGTVGVTRESYVPTADTKWSGQYLWVVTFLTRPGDVPPMVPGAAELFGNNGNATKYTAANLTLGTGLNPIRVDPPGSEFEGNEVAGAFGMDHTDPATGLVTTSNCSHFVPWLTGVDMAHKINSAFFTLGELTGEFTDGSPKVKLTGYANVKNGSVLEVGHWLSPDGDTFYLVTGVNPKSQVATLHDAVKLDAPNSGASDVSLGGVLFGVDAVDVTRTGPTQAMGYTWTVTFTNKTVGLDVPLLTSSCSSLGAAGVDLSFAEEEKGNQLAGSFAIAYDGDITPAIAYDADAPTVENALNALHSIYPSKVRVSRSAAHVDDLAQVKGYTWSITFDSSTWHDPTDHDPAAAFVEGNWQGAPVAYDSVWPNTGAGRFSRAWGKNVGELHLMGCSFDALSTSRVDGSQKCSVLETRQGSNPLSGSFQIGLDSSDALVMSRKGPFVSKPIAHNAFASAADTNGDGTSVEEILEAMPNIGDVEVSRLPANLGGNSGGYSWLVTFLRDASPCEERDAETGLCNSPGNVPKFSANLSVTENLLGSRVRTSVRGSTPTGEKGVADRGELTLLDVHDGAKTPWGVTEIQRIRTWDEAGLASDHWRNNATFSVTLDRNTSACLPWNVSAAKLQEALEALSPAKYAKKVRVERSEAPAEDGLWGTDATEAPNGYVWTVYYRGYDGDVPDPGALGGRDEPLGLSLDATKNNTRQGCRAFERFQRLGAETQVQGRKHVVNCTGSGCVDGVALRGNLTEFYVQGDDASLTSNKTGLPWNAEAWQVKREIERRANFSRTVEVSRRVIGQYGQMEWVVTFTSNPGMTPTGAGDVNPLLVTQQAFPRGSLATQPLVTETVKGSEPMGGYYTVDFNDPLQAPREVRFSETAERLERKLEEMATIHDVSVLRMEWPSNVTGGWGELPVEDGTRGGFSWQVRFLRNPGTYGGATFPPSAGDMPGIFPKNTALAGAGVRVLTEVQADGSRHLDGGSVKLVFSQGDGTPAEATAGDLAFNLDAVSVEAALEALPNLGAASVAKTLVTSSKVEGVKAVFPRDSPFGYLVGGTDLTRRVAPGEVLRFGGASSGDHAAKQGTDGELPLGGEGGPGRRGFVEQGSPLVRTDVDFSGGDAEAHGAVAAGRKLRLSDGHAYRVTKTGAEVQQIVVGAPASAFGGGGGAAPLAALYGPGQDTLLAGTTGQVFTDLGELYKLRLTFNGHANATTSRCLRFNASASEVQASLEALPNVGAGNVVVTRRGSGVLGDSFLYRVYFEGASVRGDVPLLEAVWTGSQDAAALGAEQDNVCNGVAAAKGATVRVDPWIQGGKTEVQRLGLNVDGGWVEGKFYKLRFTGPAGLAASANEANGTVSTTSCLEWGASAAELEAALQALPALSETNLTATPGVGITVNTSGLEVFGSSELDLTGGVTDGTLFVGDLIRVAGANSGGGDSGDLFEITGVGGGRRGGGKKLTVKPKVFVRPRRGTKAASVVKVAPGSVRVLRRGFGRGAVESQQVHLSANATVPPTAKGQAGWYRLAWTSPRWGRRTGGEGDASVVEERVTECLAYDASAAEVQRALNALGVDFNDNGEWDNQDENHVNVTRAGDGSARSGFGYTYTLEFRGRPHYRGLSRALGDRDEVRVVGVGTSGGCEDVRPKAESMVKGLTLDTNTSSGTPDLVPHGDLRGLLRPGDRIRVEGSLDPWRVFTVAEIDGRQRLTLHETFHCLAGSGCGAGKAVWLVEAYGAPEAWVETVVEGASQWAYDVHFVGPTLGNVEPLEVNLSHAPSFFFF